MGREGLRERANGIRELRCRYLIAVLEYPKDLRNIGAFVRNVNALGVDKAYIVTNQPDFPKEWADMRDRRVLLATSASAIRWTFVRTFPNTDACIAHLRSKGFVSIATSPHTKGKANLDLHAADFTRFKKLAVWFGNESRGLSAAAIQEAQYCVQVPMTGIIESLNLGTCSGIVLYEVTRQRRAYLGRWLEKRRQKTQAARSGLPQRPEMFP